MTRNPTTRLNAAIDDYVMAAFRRDDFDIKRSRLENILHRVFARAQVDLTISDRFGHPVKPKEWFLVPLQVINEVVDKIRDQSIIGYEYEYETTSILVWHMAERLSRFTLVWA